MVDVAGVEGLMSAADHSLRSGEHRVDAAQVTSLQDLSFFAIDVFEDGRWAA